MLTRSQTRLVKKCCKVEEVSTKKTMAQRSPGNKLENVFTIVRTRSQNNIVEKPPPLKNNISSVDSGIVTRAKSNAQVISKPTYAVNIDFDGASHEWRRNKRSVGNGSYAYTPMNI